MNEKIESVFSPESDIVLSCDDVLNFLNKVPDGFFKLIVTSPPYNIGKSYEKRVSVRDYLNTQRKIIQELVRVLSDDGSICWQTGNYVLDGEVFPLDILFYDIFKEHGLKLRNRIIWRFGHGLHANRRFSGRYETILWFTKSDNYVFNLDPVRIPSKYPGKRYYKGEKKGQISSNPKGKNPSDVWDILVEDWDSLIWDIPNVKANHPEKLDHPCQFPVELVERCVLALTNVGDCVFDPFAGVASTLVAALKNERRAFGVDKEKRYVELGSQRIKDYFDGKLKIREIGTPIYQPSGNEKIVQIPEEWR